MYLLKNTMTQIINLVQTNNKFNYEFSCIWDYTLEIGDDIFIWQE